MKEQSPESPEPRNPSPPEPASALAHVVDDDTPRIEAVAWAVEQLYEDPDFDEVAAALVEGGWSHDAALGIVEEARRQTRGHRGVFTRDEIVSDANRLYRRATGRWYIGLPMLGAAWRLLHSLATMMSLRRASRGGQGKT
jgi:hypothetical protein